MAGETDKSPDGAFRDGPVRLSVCLCSVFLSLSTPVISVDEPERIVMYSGRHAVINLTSGQQQQCRLLQSLLQPGQKITSLSKMGFAFMLIIA